MRELAERVNIWWTQFHQAMLTSIVWDTFSAIPHTHWVHFPIPDGAEHQEAQGWILKAPALAVPPVSPSQT